MYVHIQMMKQVKTYFIWPTRTAPYTVEKACVVCFCVCVGSDDNNGSAIKVDIYDEIYKSHIGNPPLHLSTMSCFHFQMKYGY